jgi:4-amino-4-deoxy-L-arabinose transferase-like glycosyltransferase
MQEQDKVDRSVFHSLSHSFISSHWFLFSLLLFVAFLLRLSHLNESLWYDELWSTHIKLRNILTLGGTILYDVHPPFYSFFMFLWIQLFGDSEISIRIPPLLFGISSILLTYKLTLKYIDKKTAFFVSWLLCVSPVHIWYSHEARHYSAILFFLLLSIYAYGQLIQSKGRPIWYFLYGFAMLSAVFSHYYISVYLILISILTLFHSNRTRRKLLIINMVILGTILLFLIIKSLFSGIPKEHGYLRSFTLFEWWMLFFHWFLSGNVLWSINPYQPHLDLSYIIFHRPVLFLIQLFYFAFFVKGAMWMTVQSISKYNSHYLDILGYLFLLPLCLFGMGLIGFKNFYIERSLFVTLPFFYIPLTIGLIRFKKKGVIATGILGTILINLITIAVFFQKGNEWTVYKPNPDWRSTALYLKNEMRGSEERLHIFAASPATELTYYDSRLTEVVSISKGVEKPIEGSKKVLGKNHFWGRKLSFEIEKEIQHRQEQITHARGFIYYEFKGDEQNQSKAVSPGNMRQFYLLHNRFWSGRFKNLLEEIEKSPKYQLEDKRCFKGIEVYKFNVRQ